RDTAGELGQTLLELLAIIVRGGLFDLRLDLGNACLDVLLFTGAVDDRRRFLVDVHPLGAAEHLERYIFQLDAEFFGNQLTGAKIARSSSMALRRSPKPGALTAATFKPPRNL